MTAASSGSAGKWRSSNSGSDDVSPRLQKAPEVVELISP